MGADLGQQVAVEIERLARAERVDRVAEAAVVVALFEAVVEPGQVEAAGEADVVRMLAEGLFVVREGFGPAAGRLRASGPFRSAWQTAWLQRGSGAEICDGRADEVLNDWAATGATSSRQSRASRREKRREDERPG